MTNTATVRFLGLANTVIFIHSFLYMLLHFPHNSSAFATSCFPICRLMFLLFPNHDSTLATSCFSICHTRFVHFPCHTSAFATSCFSICHLISLHFPPHASAFATSCSRCVSPTIHEFHFLPINRGREISYIFILHHAPTSYSNHKHHQSSTSSLILPIGIATSPSYHQDFK